MDENNTIIELINVTKSFGGMDAVSDFSLNRLDVEKQPH